MDLAFKIYDSLKLMTAFQISNLLLDQFWGYFMNAVVIVCRLGFDKHLINLNTTLIYKVKANPL